jgi:hypothetical protein
MTVTPSVTSNYSVSLGKEGDPVIPKCSMSTKTVLNYDSLVWFLRICEVIVENMGCLAIGVSDQPT